MANMAKAAKVFSIPPLAMFLAGHVTEYHSK